MKRIVKLSALLLFVAISTQTYAQKIGVKAGLNMANMTKKIDDKDAESDNDKMLMGFNVGVTGEMDITDNVALGAGLILDTKGKKNEVEKLGITTTTKTNMLYLDIPIYAKGKYVLSGGNNIYGTFGPYLGVGLSGKRKIEIKAGDDSEGKEKDTDVEWGDDITEFKRLDYGLQFGLGGEFSNIFVEATYQLGLANISNIDKTTIKHSVIGISLGYNLGL